MFIFTGGVYLLSVQALAVMVIIVWTVTTTLLVIWVRSVLSCTHVNVCSTWKTSYMSWTVRHIHRLLLNPIQIHRKYAIFNPNPIHYIGLQIRLSNQAIQSINTLDIYRPDMHITICVKIRVYV